MRYKNNIIAEIIKWGSAILAGLCFGVLIFNIKEHIAILPIVLLFVFLYFVINLIEKIKRDIYISKLSRNKENESKLPMFNILAMLMLALIVVISGIVIWT